MNVTLPLSPECQTELERRAAAAGIDVAGYIVSAVRQQLESDGNGSEGAALPYDHWKREFTTWIASHPSRNPDFDDSRESIYE
jgi:hypothetical protein